METKMLRMEFYDLPDCMKMRMEGRLVRDFAEHARTLIGHSKVPSKLVVDLSEVSFVDAVGEEVLLWFKEIGTMFVAESAYSRDVCDRLQLPMEEELPSRPQHTNHKTHRHARRCGLNREHIQIPLQGEIK
jgi:hypothetical protein